MNRDTDPIKRFDEAFARKFDAHHSAFDGDEMWSRIEAEVPERRRRRWLLAFFIFLGMGIIGGALMIDSEDAIEHNQAEPIDLVKDMDIQKQGNIKSPMMDKKKRVIGRVDEHLAKSQGTKNVVGLVVSDQLVRSPSFTTQVVVPVTPRGSIQKEISSTNVSPEKREEHSKAESLPDLRIREEKVFSILPNYSSEDRSQQVLEITPVVLLNLYDHRAVVPRSVEIFGSVGGGYTWKKLQPSKSENGDWVGRRIDSETSLETRFLSAGTLVGFSPKWGLKLGLDWISQRSRLDWRYSQSNVDILTDTTTHSLIGNDTIVAGPTYVRKNIERDVRKYNQIDILRIPVGAYYRVYFGGWALDAGLGIELSKIVNFQGVGIGRDPAELVDWSDEERWEYSTEWSMSYHSWLRAQKWIRPSVKGFIDVQLGFAGGNVLDSGDFLREKHTTLGISLGLSWHL